MPPHVRKRDIVSSREFPPERLCTRLYTLSGVYPKADLPYKTQPLHHPHSSSTTTVSSSSPKSRNPSNAAYSTPPHKFHRPPSHSHCTKKGCSPSPRRLPYPHPCHWLPRVMLHRNLRSARRSRVAAVVRGRWTLGREVRGGSKTRGEWTFVPVVVWWL